MKEITIFGDSVLIIQAPPAIHPDKAEEVRKRVVEQMKSGVVYIPPGFNYTVIEKSNFVGSEEKKQNYRERVGKNKD